MHPHTDLKTQSNAQIMQMNILSDGYSNERQSDGKSKTRKTAQRKQLLIRVWGKRLSEIIVCAGTSSRFTNKVKPKPEVSPVWLGERAQPLSSHLIVNHKLAKGLPSPANTDLGETQRITM